MAFPTATQDQIQFFREHGYLVVRDAVPQADLDELDRHCDRIMEDKPKFANDWAWDEKEPLQNRSFRIVQSSPSFVWKDIANAPYRKWLTSFAEELLGMKLSFWYDQFLAKPPGKSVPTNWHQDEAYWGRNLDDRGITCWLPLQDVDINNGCMHFIDRGHLQGVLPHHAVPGVQSDLIQCVVDESRMVVCPVARGDATFHHSKTPHMTTANTSARWRKAVTNHLQAVGSGGEGDHYPWKVLVNQRTGERKIPNSR